MAVLRHFDMDHSAVRCAINHKAEPLFLLSKDNFRRIKQACSISRSYAALEIEDGLISTDSCGTPLVDFDEGIHLVIASCGDFVKMPVDDYKVFELVDNRIVFESKGVQLIANRIHATSDYNRLEIGNNRAPHDLVINIEDHSCRSMWFQSNGEIRSSKNWGRGEKIGSYTGTQFYRYWAQASHFRRVFGKKDTYNLSASDSIIIEKNNPFTKFVKLY